MNPDPADPDDVDEYYDHLPADHPLLRKMQLALEEKLKKEEEGLRLLHKEKTEESKKIKRQREDIGISLYSLQQQFAKVEGSFNEKHNQCKTLEDQRKQEEKRLTEEMKMYNEKYQSVRDQEKMVMQSSEDLNQLNSMLRYVETYNLQVQSEIKVTRTTAIKVEENIKDNEREKKQQDFFIDYLDTQIKNLTEKKYLYEAQLKSQEGETTEARANLQEAQEEIDKIKETKRNLLDDWDKTLFSMRSKDKALQVVRDNIDEQEEEKLKLTSQIGRYRDLIQNEVFTNNTLQEEIRKLNNKQRVLDNQIAELKMKIEKQEEKRLFISNSINKTKKELEALTRQEQLLEGEIELIQKNKIKLLNEARTLAEKNIIVLSGKETHEKQADNLKKINEKLEKEIFDILVEKDAKENEIARVEIDKLNVETQNSILKKKLELMNDQITKLENIYNKKDQRIKQNHKDLEKKQLVMDKLNKDYGELMKNKKGEDEGQFEVEIDNLQTQVKNLRKDIQKKESEWLTKKQDLVRKENILNSVTDECVDKRSKSMILDRKQIRLNINYAIHEKEIKEIEFSLKQLREYEMVKFGKLLGKNMDLNLKLEHQSFDVEIQFKEKLKSMENESMKLELEIEVLREEKADTLAQIMEMERQIHLWERKIQLQEKMQEIIKPESGIKDIDEMKSTIHRQDLLYKKLKAEQEKVIKNMEMAVQRRDYIKVRYPVDKFGFGSGSSSGGTKTSSPSYSFPQKEIYELKDQVKHIINKKKDCLTSLSNTRNVVDEINNEIETLEIQNVATQNTAIEVRNDYYKEKIKTNNLFCTTSQNQEAVKIISEFNERKFRPRKKDDVEKEIEQVRRETDHLLGVLRNFKDTHIELAPIIDEAMKI